MTQLSRKRTTRRHHVTRATGRSRLRMSFDDSSTLKRLIKERIILLRQAIGQNQLRGDHQYPQIKLKRRYLLDRKKPVPQKTRAASQEIHSMPPEIWTKNAEISFPKRAKNVRCEMATHSNVIAMDTALIYGLARYALTPLEPSFLFRKFRYKFTMISPDACM